MHNEENVCMNDNVIKQKSFDFAKRIVNLYNYLCNVKAFRAFCYEGERPPCQGGAIFTTVSGKILFYASPRITLQIRSTSSSVSPA